MNPPHVPDLRLAIDPAGFDLGADLTHHPAMRLARTLRSTTALLLAALLGALGTGLPSHHHPDTPIPADKHPTVEADDHSHGTVLVEQDDRVQSGPPELPLPPERTSAVIATTIRVLPAVDRQWLPARERAPPPGAPRAPPTLL